MTEQKAKIVIEGQDRFSATFSAFERTINNSQRVTAGFQSKIANLGVTLGALGAGISVAGILAQLREVSDAMGDLKDASDATGVSVETLSALDDVARRNGKELSLVTDSLLKFNRALKDTEPDSEASRAMRAIGLSAAELRRQDPAEAMRTVAVALQGFANDGEKSRVIMALFGKSAGEAAAFLNDLADAGQINARLTAEQVEQGDKFSKTLSRIQAGISNATQELTLRMIPALNRFGEVVERAGKFGFSGLFAELLTEINSARYAVAVSKVEELADALAKNPGNEAYAEALKRARSEADALQKAAYGAGVALKEALRNADFQPGDAGAGRGFVNPEQPKPKILIADPKKPPSEAQRYLENLRKQLEATERLSVAEQALRDIQANRLDGITPKLRGQIIEQARAVDLAKRVTDLRSAEVEGQSAAARAALQNLSALLDQNEALEKEVAAIGMTEASLADLELARIRDAIATKEQTIAQREKEGADERQLQLLNEEIAALKKRAGLIVKKVDKNATEEARRAIDDVATLSRNTLADSIEEGLLDGFRRGGSLAEIFIRELKAQFAKTVLRPIIEPIAAAGNSAIEKLLGTIFGGLFGSSAFSSFDAGGAGITSSGRGLVDYGLGGGRANGGSVRGGGVYRVNENGTEEFMPAQDGVILSASQRRQAQAAQPAMNITQVYHINGDVSAQTVATIQAMIARNNQALVRSARTGGAFAGA